MKRRLVGIFIFAVFVLTTACANASYSENLQAPHLNEPNNNSYSGDGYELGRTSSEGIEASDNNILSRNGYETGTASSEEKAETTTASAPAEVVRKIIKDGSLVLKAEDIDATYASILEFAAKYKGYEFEHEKTNKGDSSYITAQIKISPEGLDSVMNFAGEAAEVITSNVSSDDITSDYYDAQIRLTSQKKSLEKYYEFLAKANNIQETLSIQSEINKITMDIESLEGQLKMWNANVQESTLKLSIYQIDDPLRVTDEIVWNSLSFSNMGKLIKIGFMGVVNVLVSIVQWVAIILLSISPLLIIAAIVIVILRIRSKKGKGQNINKKNE